MTKEHKAAEQKFYTTIGEDLHDLVVLGPEGLCMDGHFTAEQWRLLWSAYEEYLAGKTVTQ